MNVVFLSKHGKKKVGQVLFNYFNLVDFYFLDLF
jgi:hypothetical protein